MNPESRQLDPASQRDVHAASERGPGRLWHNFISLFGLTVAAIALVLTVTFVMFSLVTPGHNPYVDVIGYLVLPFILIGGLLIVPIGMWIQLRARSGRGALIRWLAGLHLDFSNPRHRRMAVLFAALNVFAILPVIAVSGYHGYHYTESTEFCANVCHAVMEPQGTTHAISPHARVACAECHIGSGAGWFVKSKLSGVRQVIAVMNDTYERPIPPAITDLRPARDTCEQCHWPSKFFGSQLKETVHFSSDEANTRHVVRMLLKTGGADDATGRIEGIHMHMALSGPIEYVATDPHLQEIPWVRYVNAADVETIYRSDKQPSSAPPPQGVTRHVDCMDCHNRGAHRFRSPQETVNMYLDAGVIDKTLPFIKREAVSALVERSKSETDEPEIIGARLRNFYRDQYPELWASRQKDVEAVIEKIDEIYDKNFFHHMKVNWQTYPDNIGHLRSSGCFRCHDGQHVSSDGRVLPSACDVCHTFLNPVEGVAKSVAEGSFTHSVDLQIHENLRCDQCHTGGPLPSCRDCHASGAWLENYGKDKFEWNKRR